MLLYRYGYRLSLQLPTLFVLKLKINLLICNIYTVYTPHWKSGSSRFQVQHPRSLKQFLIKKYQKLEETFYQDIIILLYMIYYY